MEDPRRIQEALRETPFERFQKVFFVFFEITLDCDRLAVRILSPLMGRTLMRASEAVAKAST